MWENRELGGMSGTRGERSCCLGGVQTRCPGYARLGVRVRGQGLKKGHVLSATQSGSSRAQTDEDQAKSKQKEEYVM